MESLGARLDIPEAKRSRVDVLEKQAVVSADLAEDEQSVELDDIYVKLSWVNIFQKKTMRVPVGVGGRVRHGEVLVTLHDTISKGSDGVLLSTTARSTLQQPDPTFLMKVSAGNVDQLEASTMSYSCGVQWTILDTEESPRVRRSPTASSRHVAHVPGGSRRVCAESAARRAGLGPSRLKSREVCAQEAFDHELRAPPRGGVWSSRPGASCARASRT